jgi:hypothetical protein
MRKSRNLTLISYCHETFSFLIPYFLFSSNQHKRSFSRLRRVIIDLVGAYPYE